MRSRHSFSRAHEGSVAGRRCRRRGMRSRPHFICCLALLGGVVVSAAEIVLSRADSMDGVRASWGEQNPAMRVEINTDPRFIAVGAGSLHVHSVGRADRSGSYTYAGIRVAVEASRLEGQALFVDIWSTTPDNIDAFWVRGYNGEGTKTLGWRLAPRGLTPEGQTYVLNPGVRSQYCTPEEPEATEQEITSIDFIAGSRADGEPFEFYVDHIRLGPAPEPPPVNYIEHGVFAPVGRAAATLTTVDGDGRCIVFCKLSTGSASSYLFVDAETGDSQAVSPGIGGGGAYTVLLSRDNVIYDTMGRYMVAIDVPTRTVRRIGSIPSGFALSFAESNDGLVYAGIYPHGVLVSYDPASDTFTNHGAMIEETWPKYLRPMAVDSSGWVYGGIAMEKMQIIGFNRETGEIRHFIPEENRKRGYIPTVYLGTDGQVYARADRNTVPRDAMTIYEDGWGWHVMSDGVATPIEEPPVGAVTLHGRGWKDGSRLVSIDVPDRILKLREADAEEVREVRFDYESSGVNVYTLTSGPDGAIYGATGNPLRFCRFDPATGEMWDRALPGGGGHLNQLVVQNGKLYGASYSTGALVEFDPELPFDSNGILDDTNPRRVHHAPEAFDLYGRPRAVLAHPDGRHVLVGGSAARVLLGSGLLIYDRESETGTILDRADLISDHGISAMAALPDGDVLIGTTLHAPTAGRRGPAPTAMVYRLDLRERVIKARCLLEPDTPAVRDMVVAANGLVYGFAEPNRLFVLDPENHRIVHDEPIVGYGNVAGYQAPRCMIIGPDGAIYTLFRQAVVRIDPATREASAIAWPVAPITTGIAIYDSRLYFTCGPRLFSCKLPE